MAETLSKEHLKEVAQTILDQIIGTTTWSVRWSWGMNNPRYTQYQNYPALIFSVNGFLFSGVIIVALDEGHDVYRLYLWDKVNEPQLVNDIVTSWVMSLTAMSRKVIPRRCITNT
jgi:hypothetical protein